MPIVRSTDVFIERSLNLLLSNPSETRISITYGSKTKKESKHKHKVTKPSNDEAHKSFVSFKVYDPNTGSLYKLNTTKTKVLSRVLTALGPHGVTLSKNNETETIKGFSSVLANTEVPEYTEEESAVEKVQQQQQQQASSASSSGSAVKKGKKKKGKK